MYTKEEFPNDEMPIFEWVFWATHVIFPPVKTQDYSKFVKIILTKDQIRIENQSVIPISEILSCDNASMSRYHSISTKLILKDGMKIEIAVADPFYPNFKNRDNFSEARAFKEIINDLMTGKIPKQPQNPYNRAKKKAGFYPNDIEYDPHRSPMEYFDQFRKRWTTSEIIKKVIACVITWILGLLVILLIVHYLS